MPTESPEARSRKLEKIRKDLRNNLDSCVTMKRRSEFNIAYDSDILLTASEQRAMKVQIEEYRRDVLTVKATFTEKRRKHNKLTSRITVHAQRKRVAAG